MAKRILLDACLVVMTERFEDCTIVTLDGKDFSVYRRHDREAIPFLAQDWNTLPADSSPLSRLSPGKCPRGTCAASSTSTILVR